MQNLSSTLPSPPRKLPTWAMGATIWVLLRLITSLWAAIVSAIRPLQPIEKAISLWPPSSPLGDWLYRVLISPLMRWDTAWYQRILTQGYRPDDGTSSFHPLFPLLAKPMVSLGLDPAFSLLMVSTLAGVGLIYFWIRLASLDKAPEETQFSLVVFFFSPMAFILFVPYTEALFLLLSVMCVIFTRQRRWLWAGIFGGLAVLTRQQGIFLVLFMVWEIWELSGKEWRKAITDIPGWLGASLIPISYFAWLAYRGFFLNDVSIDWSHPTSFFESFLISSSHAQVVPVFKFIPPWQALGLAIQKILTNPDLDIWVNLIFAGIYLALLALAWGKISGMYRGYSLIVILVAFSYHTGMVHPYMGLVRHIWLAFPIFLGLASRIKAPWARLAYVGLGWAGLLFLQMLYGLEGWVP